MNKKLFLLILTIISLGLTSCNDDNDIKTMDLKLMNGAWMVVDQGTQDVFERGCIIDITTSPYPSHGSYGALLGSLTTYFINVAGNPVHDKAYSWTIRNMENHQPLLDLTFQGDLDSDDPWDGQYFYKITKLTDTHMWWQVNTNGNNSIIKFQRRPDLTLN